MKNRIDIQNKKARFNYELLDGFTAGIVLSGTEIKSLRLGKASITESFCEFNDTDELFVVNMTIEEYAHGSHYNHLTKASRKLLLNKRELKKIRQAVKIYGNTVVPTRLFINERGLAKLNISLAKGKKLFDKRETIKDRDNKKQLDRVKKALIRH